MRRPLVSNEPPRWYLYSVKVTVGQRFHLLLDHRHLVLEVAVHDMVAEYFARYALLMDTLAPDNLTPETTW